MSRVDYKAIGFTKTVSDEDTTTMKTDFHTDPTKGAKGGTYVGLTELQKMVASLVKGKYDGLQICYGLSQPQDAEEYGRIELILTEVKLSGPATKPKIGRKKGLVYCTVNGSSTEPPGLECPPLVCNPPGAA